MTLIPLCPHAPVAVITGSFGAGHDRAAYEISRRLEAAGHPVRTLDIVDVMPMGLGRLLRWAYFLQLRILPASWGTLLGALTPGSALERVVRRLLAALGRRLPRHLSGAETVIATHPFAALALGRLRTAGRVNCPVATYLTDASVHPLWVDPGVDVHLTWNPTAADAVRRLGGQAQVVAPLLPEVAETATALPGHDTLPDVLIVGGSQGVGELEEAAADVLATGLAHPVVLCGYNERLRNRLAHVPGVTALGWRDDAAALVAASACVIQNAGGFTSLEAVAAGTPVITYRAIPGHGQTNAAALDEIGVAPWARSYDELTMVLWAALARPRSHRAERARQHDWDAPDLLDIIGSTPVAA